MAESSNINSNLDEEKIKVMTKLAIYEKRQKKEERMIGNFYQEDYVKINCVVTFITTTVCYLIFVGIYFLDNYQSLIDGINDLDYFQILKKIIIGYIGFLLVIMVLAILAYNIRFYLARRQIVDYNRNLRKFIKIVDGDSTGKKKRKSKRQVQAVKVSNGIGGDDFEEFQSQQQSSGNQGHKSNQANQRGDK